MFNSEILEVAIGLVFVFLVISLVASAIREAIESLLKTRAIQLERGIRQLLDDPEGTDVTKHLFEHPLLYGLFPGDYDPGKQLTRLWRRRPGQLFGWVASFLKTPDSDVRTAGHHLRAPLMSKLPAYIPSRNFALALLDLVSGTGGSGQAMSFDTVRANAMAMPEGRLKQAVLVALAEGKGDIDRARTSLEAWYDSNMDRISGWYKRETQWVLMAIGLFLAVTLNVDTVHAVHELASNNTTRAAVVARAYATFPEGQQRTLTPEELAKAQKGLSQVIGWARIDKKFEKVNSERRTALTEQARQLTTLTDEQARREWVDDRMPSLFWQRANHSAPLVLGWLITALAISLGAPFWFDVLNKFMVIRSTVKPYEKSGPEGSEDRRGAPGAAAQLATAPGAGAPGGAAPGGAAAAGAAAASLLQPMPQHPEAAIRLALDHAGLDPGSLSFTVDGGDVPVPPDGFLELPLTAGESHSLEANARRAGQPVAWRRELFVTLADERAPLDATLS